MHAATHQHLGILVQQGLEGAAGLLPPLDNARVAQDVGIMAADVPLGHHKADIPHLLPLGLGKSGLPVKRDIAALHDQVLLVFKGGLDDAAEDGPEVPGEGGVAALGGQAGLAAADQPHLELVDREVGVVVFFQQPLGQQGLAGVGCTRDQ